MADNKRKIEILERLRDTCQIPLEDSQEQLDIIREQEQQIKENKKVIKNNFDSLDLRFSW